MKKLLLLASLVLTAALMVSCEPPTPPPGPAGTLKLNTLSKAEYHGEAHGAGSGFYTFTLSDESGNKVRIDCFGSVSSSAASARLTTGDYIPGTMAEHKIRTFATAESGDAAEGTVYWIGDKAYPVDGGTMNVTASGGSFRINIDFTSGESGIKGSFDGPLKFENKSTFPPREKDPDPRVAESLHGMYYGMFGDPQAKTGRFVFKMAYKGDLSKNENLEAISMTGYMPLQKQEDHENVILPEGTYTVTDKDINDAFTLQAGTFDNNFKYSGTYETYTDDKTSVIKGYMVSEGTMKVEKNGDNYKITVNLKGKRADKTSVIGKELEEINYVYEGPLEPMINYADPMSQMKESKDLGTITNQALLQVRKDALDSGLTAWLYYIWDDGLKGTLVDKTLTISGTGNMVVLAVWGEPQSTDNPVGEFIMSPGYLQYYENNKNVAMAANPLSATVDDPVQGCFYSYITQNGDRLSATDYCGAMPRQGRVITSVGEDGVTQIVDFEFYDRKGLKVTGRYEGKMDVVTE